MPGPDLRPLSGAATLILACLVPFSAMAAELAVQPGRVEFADPYSRSQLLVETDGHDLTRDVRYESTNPAVVRVDSTGFVAPVGPGEAVVRVIHSASTREVPVRVSAFNTDRRIDFATEIMPLLTRFGCNAGGCHGKANGQNGFKLSLFGFDAKFDYDALTSEARGRRVFSPAPERSLLLTKATAVVPHGGGKRIEVGSEPYRVLYRWIESGTPASAPDVPHVTKIEITPRERILQPKMRQQLSVSAVYSDGTRRDVTREAEYSSNIDVVAAADSDALVTAGENSGEAAIMARYMGQVAVFRAIIPHGQPLKEIAGFEPANYIDRLAVEKWKKLGLQPSPVCDDATFLRRVSVDLCGRLPTADEVRTFLGDASADKRAKAIDRLLESPDYPAFFALRWSSILRNSRLAGADQASYAFHNWIKDQIARNRPYDEFVRGIVAAAGEWQSAPAINWLWQSRDDQLHQVTADTAQIFLGIRLQCARCHHHPYEKWGQEDYYGLTGFFTRLGRKSFGQPPPYYSAPNVTVGDKNPLTGQTPKPKYLDGDYAEFSPEQDPRHGLVDWMAKPDNRFFSKVLVNRLWGHFLGRGLVDQIDDMRETNPPSNPELLEALAADFEGSRAIDAAGNPQSEIRNPQSPRFDVKRLIRTILNSKVYQLSSEPTEANKHDHQNFARYYARRMYAEVLHDALDQACGTRTRFSGVSSNARAVDLPHEGFGSYFLDTFDRPRRVTGCECERSSGATLAQVLLVANSDEVENKIASGEGHIARGMKDKRPVDQMVDDLYLSAFSRRPTDAERKVSIDYVMAEKEENRQKALEDVLWSLVNSKEFMFNH